MKLYSKRDTLKLSNFTKHMEAMTKESLYSKSDIAAELAYRDEEIVKLKKKLEQYEDT